MAGSDKNVTEIIKNFEDELKIKDNLLRVTTKKLLMYKSRSRIKLFHYTDDELEEIADKCRMRNGKLNLSKMGRVVGADPDTVKNEIGRRNLTYLHNSSKK